MIVSSNFAKDTRKGTLLKLLLTQMADDLQLQTNVFKHYVPQDKFGKLYAEHWLKNDTTMDIEKFKDLPLHDLIVTLANRDHIIDQSNVLSPSGIEYVKVNILQNYLVNFNDGFWLAPNT